MGVEPFDYEFWRDGSRADWRHLGIHWHCYAWRGDGKDHSDEPARE